MRGELLVPLLLLVLLSARALGADKHAGPWKLLTEDTRVRLSIVADELIMEQLECPKVGYNWAEAGLRLPLPEQGWVEGAPVVLDWRFASAEQRDEQTLVLSFECAKPELTLRSCWRAFEGPGPVQHWMELVNNSPTTFCVGHQDSLSLEGLKLAGPTDLWWIRRGAQDSRVDGATVCQPVESDLDLELVSHPERSNAPVPWLAVQAGNKQGLYVGWEFSAIGRVEASAGQTAEELTVRVGLMPDFRTDVYAGETFLVPPAFVGCHQGDVEEGSYRLGRFLMKHLRAESPAWLQDPVLAWNCYFDAGPQNPPGYSAATTEGVLASARNAAKAGFEVFIPDAMWFPHVGDWRWDPKRFPEGPDPITSWVHEQGMKMGLWHAWTNAGLSEDPQALSVRRNAEWLNADYPPDWQPGPFYGGLLCLACEPAKEWVLATVDRTVEESHLDYYKHDITPIVTTCNKTTHRHHYGVDVSYWATLGYYQVMEHLKQTFPWLVLENCSGAGHIKDFGAMARSHYCTSTDWLSALPNRCSLYDSTYAFPPTMLQVYTQDWRMGEEDEPGPYFWRSAMMASWQAAPINSASYSPGLAASFKHSVDLYKKSVRPVLQDCRVHHVLPRPDGVHWDALFFFSEPLKRGLLFVFKPKSEEPTCTVLLKGLAPDRNYHVWCEDGNLPPARLKGKQLMEKGLTFALSGYYQSELVYVQDEALPLPEGLAPPERFTLGEAVTNSDQYFANARFVWQRAPEAQSWRVLVSTQEDLSEPVADVTSYTPAMEVVTLPAGKQLYWGVEARSWGGKRWNEGGSKQFTTPPLDLPAGVVFLSDLPWEKAEAGSGVGPFRDKSYSSAQLNVAGEPQPRGLWTHAFPDATPADIVWDLSGLNAAWFAANVGVDQGTANGTVQFQVLLDDKLVVETPVLNQGQIQRLKVAVTGARKLTLRVLNGGDGYSCDHSVWGLARLLSADVEDPFE